MKQYRYRKVERQYVGFDASKGFLSDNYKEMAEYLERQSFDLLIVRSIAVLNFYHWNYSKNQLPIYWLPQDISCKKVMLSSSIGTDLTLAQLNQEALASVRDSIKGFSLLGVRDQMAYDFIQSLDESCVDKMRVMPDPTFSYVVDQLPAEKHLRKRKIDPDIPVIGLDLPLDLPGLRRAIEHLKEKGYYIAS